MVFNTRAVTQKECNAYVGLGGEEKEGGEGLLLFSGGYGCTWLYWMEGVHNGHRGK